MASGKREHLLIAASIAACAGLCFVVLMQFLGILPDFSSRPASKPPAVVKVTPKPVAPPLPVGVVHVADAYAAIDALAANDLGKDWWKGTVRGSVALVDVGNQGQAFVVIADLRGETSYTVTVSCKANDAVSKLRRGEVVTVRGRGRQRDFYRPGSVLLDDVTFLPNG